MTNSDRTTFGDSFSPASRTLLTLGALVVVMAGVKAAESIVNPLLLALFIAAISAPFYSWMVKRRIPAVIALLLVTALLVLLGVSITSLVSSSLEGFSANLPSYQERLQTMLIELVQQGEQLGLPVSAEDISQIANPGAIMGFVGTAFNRLVGVLTNVVFILLLVAFMLVEISSVPTKLRYLSNQPEQHIQHFEEILKTINRYFGMKSLLSLLTAIPLVLLLMWLDVDYPLLWGLLAFLLNFVPNVGSLIAAIPPVLLALVDHGLITAVWVMGGYLLVNNLVGNVLEPKLLGHSLGLSTLVVFLSLVIWGWLLGPVGMFLSVPITVTIKIGLERSDEMRWLAVWLGTAQDDHKLPEWD